MIPNTSTAVGPPHTVVRPKPAGRFTAHRFAVSSEGQRRVFVRLIMAIYWMLIFEGALRKWIFPNFGQLLFFVRDPLIIACYGYALINRMYPRRAALLTWGIAFAFMSVPVMILQFAASGSRFSWLVALYGWRNYFLYLPISFFVAKYFTRRDIDLLIRRTLQVSIPIAVLVYFQFRAPGSAAINQGFGTTDLEVYSNPGVAMGVVRTFGTFTSSLGQTVFVAIAVSMLLATWLMPVRTRLLRGPVLLAATAAVLTCLAVSGSRTSFVWSGVAFVTGIVAGVVVGPRRMKLTTLLTPVALVVVAIVLMPFVFPRAIEAFAERWRGANEAESQTYGSGGIYGRAFYSALSFTTLMKITPPQGYQFGGSGNGAKFVSGGDRVIVPLTLEETMAGESDWGRHILEFGTVFGLLFILFRVCWFGVQLAESITATRRLNSPLPLLLFVVPGVLLLTGLITGNGTCNGFVWLLAGVSMAANRECLPQPSDRFGQ
jgi:hypothetical protein